MDKIDYAVFASLIVAKIALLVIFGPVLTPDSLSYRDMAQTMLSSRAWLHDAGLAQGYFPPFAFRIIGYPAFLAATISIAGPAWAYLVVCVQSAVSLTVGWTTLRLGDALDLPRRVALLAAVASATSLQLTLDQCILTDSLNASFVILAIVLILRGAKAGGPLSAGHAVSAGLLLAVAFLLREFMQALIVLFLPILAARAAATAKGLRARTVAAAILVLVPPLATMEGYREWNAYRTGERFVTTGAQTALLQALTSVAHFNNDFFSTDTALDNTMRRHLRIYIFSEVVAVNATLFEQGYSATDIARMATAKYLSGWRERPFAMLSLLREISENQVKYAVRPVTATCEIIEWGDSQPLCPDYRDVYQKLFKTPSQLTVVEAAALVAISVQNALSIAVFAAFLIGVPIFVIAARTRKNGAADRPAVLLLAAFWLVYCGWDLAHVFIHFENRYLAPIIPLSAFGGLFVIREAARLRWRRA